MSANSSPFPSCFRPSNADHPISAAAAALPPPPPPPPQVQDDANLTTCLYHTHLGIFSLTWSKYLFGRSLHILLHVGAPSFDSSSSSPTISFHLHMKNLLFWKKQGSKKLRVDCPNGDHPCASVVRLSWDLTRAKYGSGPEPMSGFFVSVTVDGVMGLLVGDLEKLAYSRTRARGSEKSARRWGLFLRREHVFGNGVYTTTARIGDKETEISVDCNVSGEGKLSFCMDKKRVLHVKRLKWKFRGNERVEFDGSSFQVSWDVYNWLFEDRTDRHAVFMFRFDRQDVETEDLQPYNVSDKDSSYNLLSTPSSCSFGMNEIELRKMRKSMARTARSSSSSSVSSSASSCGSNSSVMEWASTEENELTRPIGFSLLVYAWKR